MRSHWGPQVLALTSPLPARPRPRDLTCRSRAGPRSHCPPGMMVSHWCLSDRGSGGAHGWALPPRGPLPVEWGAPSSPSLHLPPTGPQTAQSRQRQATSGLHFFPRVTFAGLRAPAPARGSPARGSPARCSSPARVPRCQTSGLPDVTRQLLSASALKRPRGVCIQQVLTGCRQRAVPQSKGPSKQGAG